MNKCTFTGRFTAAPRRQDTDKTSRCFFTLMVNKDGKKPDGTKYPAQAVDFVAWGKTAELICQYKDKGHLVLIDSEFSTYERDAIDMNNQPIANARKIQRPIFTVRTVEFMPVNNNGNSNGQAGYQNNNQGNNSQATNNQGNNSNVNASDIPTYNGADFPADPIGNSGEIPFDQGLGEDPFALGDL